VPSSLASGGWRGTRTTPRSASPRCFKTASSTGPPIPLFACEQTADTADALSAIRRSERENDEIKYDLLRRTFADGPTAEALAVRELVVRMDDVAKAAEDAADHAFPHCFR
jgi:hypothetical protein